MKKISECFEIMNRSGIAYCHFKSNAHLDKSFSGKTDFDLLVARNDIYKLQEILLKYGFKRRESTFNKKNIEMEDFLFFDEITGDIHHFHIHYKLIFGKKYKKVYSLFPPEILLENSLMHDKYPIRVLVPEYELVLLIIRIYLKIVLVNFSKTGVKNIIIRAPLITENIIEEIDYLTVRVDFVRFKEILSKINAGISESIEEFIRLYRKKQLSKKDLLFPRHKLIRAIRDFMVISENQVKYDMRLRKVHLKRSRSWLSGGGIMIGIVGADGAGKSTITNEVQKWLSYKISAEIKYLGRLKNDYLLESIRFISKVFHKLKFNNLHQLTYNLSHVYVAFRRLNIYKNAKYSVGTGCTVIFDRYPLREFWEMDMPMDGPRVKSSFRLLHTIERCFYKDIEPYPEILIVLQIPLDVSVKRKPEHKNEILKKQIEKKITAVNQLSNSIKEEDIYFIDASQELNKVIIDIKRIIWSRF